MLMLRIIISLLDILIYFALGILFLYSLLYFVFLFPILGLSGSRTTGAGTGEHWKQMFGGSVSNFVFVLIYNLLLYFLKCTKPLNERNDISIDFNIF